jgi:hypothetical protein
VGGQDKRLAIDSLAVLLWLHRILLASIPLMTHRSLSILLALSVLIGSFAGSAPGQSIAESRSRRRGERIACRFGFRYRRQTVVNKSRTVL